MAATKPPWLSRKLWVTLVGFALIFFAYRDSVTILLTVKEEWRAVALVSMFNTAFYILGGLCLGYAGLQSLITGWQHKTEATVSQMTSYAVQTAAAAINKAPKDFDDLAEIP